MGRAQVMQAEAAGIAPYGADEPHPPQADE